MIQVSTKMMNCVLKREEFCIKSADFGIKNVEFCFNTMDFVFETMNFAELAAASYVDKPQQVC